jgi:DNA-binding response OmpR family regulator
VVSWQVEELDDPRAVRGRLEESSVDAVIVDMQVGSKGGMAVIRAIRQETDPITRPRLILLMDRSADEFLAGRAGADAAVLKPFDPPSLRAALDPALLGPADEEE